MLDSSFRLFNESFLYWDKMIFVIYWREEHTSEQTVSFHSFIVDPGSPDDWTIISQTVID